MFHQQLNSIFAKYTPTLYSAAKRMIDKRHPQYDDKVQDLVVLAYEEFIRKANEGKIMELPLVIHYMKFRKAEVQIEMRGYSRTSKTDVFNKRNFYEGKMELYSIDNPVFDGEGDTYADIIRDESDFERQVSFNIDVQQNLSKLSEIERLIIDKKISGYKSEEIAEMLSVQTQSVANAIERVATHFTNQLPSQMELQL